MFWKKKKVDEYDFGLPPIDYSIGEPELSGGKQFWPVYRNTPYWKWMGLHTYRPIQMVSFTTEKIKYFESAGEAANYIRKITEEQR